MRSNETAYTADSQLVRIYLQKNKKKVGKVNSKCEKIIKNFIEAP